MAENFSIEHSRTKITEVKKTIEDKKQKLDELKQQKRVLWMRACVGFFKFRFSCSSYPYGKH